MVGLGILGALAGLGAASTALSGGISYGMQKDQQAFNAAEAQKSRDWQKMMSDTQYQRQVADMEAAGLNPAAIGASSGGTSFGTTEASSAIAQSPNTGMIGALAYNALKLLSSSKEGQGALIESVVDSTKSSAVGALFDETNKPSFQEWKNLPPVFVGDGGESLKVYYQALKELKKKYPKWNGNTQPYIDENQRRIRAQYK